MIGLLRGPVVLRTGECEVIIDVGGVGYRVNGHAVDRRHAGRGERRGRGDAVRAHARARGRHRPVRLRARRRAPLLRGAAGVARGRAGAGAGASWRCCRPAALSTAVLEDDLDTLCTVPGVGRKTAARLLIELKSRLDLPDLSLDPVGRRRRRRPALHAGDADVEGRGAGGPERAGLRPRRDPRCARRPTRRCRRGRDAAPGAARAGLDGEPTGTPRGPGCRGGRRCGRVGGGEPSGRATRGTTAPPRVVDPAAGVGRRGARGGRPAAADAAPSSSASPSWSSI